MNGRLSPVEQVDLAFYYIVGISLVLLFAITATMVYFVIRYRRSKNPQPSETRGNWILETAWTAISAVIALSMFYFGWSSYIGLRNVPPDALEIEVIGQMYSWIFIYPNGKETENELVVPEGKPIKLNVTSEDVLHSLFVPAFRIKVDAVRGMDTYAWFYADKIGIYHIQCAEYCGVGHSDMTAILRIVSKDEYIKWFEMEEED